VYTLIIIYIMPKLWYLFDAYKIIVAKATKQITYKK
jgi:hypothetical protein